MPWKCLSGCVNHVFNFGLVPGRSFSTMTSYATNTCGARNLSGTKIWFAIHQVSNAMAETKTKIVLPISIQKTFQYKNLNRIYCISCDFMLKIYNYSAFIAYFYVPLQHRHVLKIFVTAFASKHIFVSFVLLFDMTS